MAKRNLMNGAAIPMEPGERDKAVAIEQLNEQTADSGFPVEPWSTLKSPVWMRKMDAAPQGARSRERVTADQIAAFYETQWEMGYMGEMDPELVDVPTKRRLVYQGRVHQIVAASLIGRREGIELLTVAGSGGEL